MNQNEKPIGVQLRSGQLPGIRFSIIIMVDKPEEVDALAHRVLQAGVTLTKAPADANFFEGRNAYFADPEGNYREVAWGHQTIP